MIKDRVLFFFFLNHWVMNLTENQKLLPESILALLTLYSAMKESGTQEWFSLTCRLRCCLGMLVSSLLGQLQCWSHSTADTLLWLFHCGWTYEAPVTRPNDAADGWPKPSGTWESSSAVKTLKSLLIPSCRKIPPGRHSNRVQSAKPACCSDLIDIKCFG